MIVDQSRPLSYIEIYKDRLLSNVQFFRRFLLPSTQIVGVIKANAYGHGLQIVSKILEDYVDYYQVDDIEELRELRKVSNKPAFVFGYIQRNDLEEMVYLDGILGVYDKEQIELINKHSAKLNKKTKLHVCIDSALGRDGMLLSEVQPLIDHAKRLENIIIDGIYSHFANIEDTSDFSHAQKQIDLYEKAIQLFRNNGYTEIKTHISATAGSLVYESKFHRHPIVRIGIGLYGLWPSEYIRRDYTSYQNALQPVLRWVSHIAQIKTLPKNSTIGYGLTYVTDKPTTIAIVPQGYSDGYDRKLSNKGEVLIRGKRCKVLGRISMNMMTVDVTDIDGIQIEDEVVLIGSQHEENITSEEIAEKIDTINYEVVARLNPNIPRIVI
jgi:alanine racemase